MARICIITPGQLGSNPRVVKEATALTEAGHDVHVISTRFLDLVDRRDDDVLASAGWTSERLDFRSALRRRVRRGAQLAARSAFRVTGALAPWADNMVAPALEARALNQRADLYIAHYVAALSAAGRAAKRHAAAYAFDAEDFHLGDEPDIASEALNKRLIRAVEARWLPGCAYVTAASPGIAKAYCDTYGLTAPTVVLNVFPAKSGPPAATPSGQVALGPSVYWFSQTIGPERGLECAVRAIAMTRSRAHLYLRGSIAAGFDQHLTALAVEGGAADRLHFLEPAPPSEMERLAAQYDVGLVAETGATANRRIALTNKQFTYFLAGIPAVMSDVPAHKDLEVLAPGAAFLFETNDAVSLAAAIDHLLTEPPRLAQARAAAFKLGRSRFNWDHEKAKLLAVVDRALSGARRRTSQAAPHPAVIEGQS